MLKHKRPLLELLELSMMASGEYNITCEGIECPVMTWDEYFIDDS